MGIPIHRKESIAFDLPLPRYTLKGIAMRKYLYLLIGCVPLIILAQLTEKGGAVEHVHADVPSSGTTSSTTDTIGVNSNSSAPSAIGSNGDDGAPPSGPGPGEDGTF